MFIQFRFFEIGLMYNALIPSAKKTDQKNYRHQVSFITRFFFAPIFFLFAAISSYIISDQQIERKHTDSDSQRPYDCNKVKWDQCQMLWSNNMFFRFYAYS